MANRQWFVVKDGKHYGPYLDEKLRELIAAYRVTADTLVWCQGMSDWARAGEIPGLVSTDLRPPPLPSYATATAGNSAEALSINVRMWPLFGRVLLLWLCAASIVPLPWAATSFLRWFVDHTELPNKQRVAFVGRAADIWYIFILYSLCIYIPVIFGLIVSLKSSHLNESVPHGVDAVQFLLIPLTALLSLAITRWFYSNLVWDGRSTSLQFIGGYWPLLGWSILAPLSFITIVGWAWVFTAWARWMCSNVVGSNRQFLFTASGWSFLWRTFLFAFSIWFVVVVALIAQMVLSQRGLAPLGLLLIALASAPIAWSLRWYTGWLVSQFALRGRSAAP